MVASPIEFPLTPRHGGFSFNLWHALWDTRLQRSASQFARAVHHTKATQEGVLRTILRQNASSQYGREHGFAAIQTIADFQRKVPVVNYETLAPWMEQVADGRQHVLTREPVVGLRRSAGQGERAKLIPVTQSSLQEFALGMDTWLSDWISSEVRGSGTSLYWALPPASREPQRSQGGLPYLNHTLDHQLGRAARLALGPHLAVPSNVADIANEARWRRTTLANLLAAGDLRVMVCGNPALLLDLLTEMQEYLPDMLARLPAERADAIRSALDGQGQLRAKCLWPQLRSVVTWTDGASAALCDRLSPFFSGVRMRTAPITTQEAMLTVPRQRDAGGALAVTSHFFEFLDLDVARGQPLQAHEVKVGGVYQPLVTSGSGLYRYQMGEAVRCTGIVGQTPLLTYVDKTTPKSDCVGEALPPYAVQAALDFAQARLQFSYDFALCVPHGQTPAGYTLFIETGAGRTCLEALGELMEEQLCRRHAYWHARQLGHLQHLRVARTQQGWQRYLQAQESTGGNRWEAKPTALDRRDFWPSILKG